MYYLFSIPVLLYPVLKKGQFSCPRQVQGTSMDKIFFTSSCLWGDHKLSKEYFGCPTCCIAAVARSSFWLTTQVAQIVSLKYFFLRKWNGYSEQRVCTTAALQHTMYKSIIVLFKLNECKMKGLREKDSLPAMIFKCSLLGVFYFYQTLMYVWSIVCF